MVELVLHEVSKMQLDQAANNPPQVLALIGPDGIGKSAVAYMLLGSILKLSDEQLRNYQYGRLLEPKNGSIPIEEVRELTKFLKLKTGGTNSIRRFAVIEHAETMTGEAQNALLKTLEEPPSDSIIILTMANGQVMLPTVMSRVRSIDLHLPRLSQLREFFSAGVTGATTDFEQQYRLSGGLPGLMQALNSEQSEHPLYAAVGLARQVLQSSVFERLCLVDGLAKQKDETMALLQVLARMADATLKQAAAGNNYTAIKRWQRVLEAAYSSQKLIRQGAQAKLALTRLMLEL